MATRKQIEANRKNAARSTGPKSPTGKARAKMNGLKHGLRAQEVVLPTEDRAAFQEHLDAWMADWQPPTMARRALVEQAAVADWRMKRCIRVETGRLSRRVHAAYADWDRDERKCVDRIVEELRGGSPREALEELLSTRAGVERAIAFWLSLGEAAESPTGWDDEDDHHFRLISLHGLCAGDDEAAPLKEASWRLYLRNAPEEMIGDDDPAPWDDDEAAYVCGEIRRISRDQVALLRSIHAELPDDAAARDRYAERSAFEPQPEDAPLLRYEGQLNRQFHKSLDGLVKLTKSEADLIEPEDDAPSEPNPDGGSAEISATAEVADESLGDLGRSTASAPVAAPSEPKGDGPVRPSATADRDLGGRIRAVAEGIEAPDDPSTRV